MNKKSKPYTDPVDLSEEYFRKKGRVFDEHDLPYFPPEEAKPPHY